ncbi:hypothetical protein IRJ41_008819 [Triplophysa rosa]|uniref:Uncharacterized protein n=1 Tax=Triplophysa rosa TaxID=992332 RepID=A0A9W7X2V2_TRIRA|nr:hypothetical protein IRJ41_008819 [Triplophysa rosa]
MCSESGKLRTIGMQRFPTTFEEKMRPRYCGRFRRPSMRECETYLPIPIHRAEESIAVGADRVTQLVARETPCFALATHFKPKTFKQEWSFIMHTKPCFLWLNSRTSLWCTLSSDI